MAMAGLEVRDRVDGGASEPDLEVQVGSGGVPGAADVPDDRARGDVLADDHGDARLVPVERAHAATVVDDDRVAVPALRARDHDLARLARADRRAGRRDDVDTGVEAGPPTDGVGP